MLIHLALLVAWAALAHAGVRVPEFAAEVRVVYTAAEGLPSSDVLAIALGPGQAVFAGTAQGLAAFSSGRWRTAPGPAAPVVALAAAAEAVFFVAEGRLYRWEKDRAVVITSIPAEARPPLTLAVAGGQPLLGSAAGLFRLEGTALVKDSGFATLAAGGPEVRQIAVGPDGELAVAALAGLFVKRAGGNWRTLHPRQASRSWAPHDVRGVAYDGAGQLWFASPQGVGRRGQEWTLFTPEDGLPYDDFTTAAGARDAVWFGTRIGAIRFDGRMWEYRQGLRWLPDDPVRAVAIEPSGNAWFATAKGAGLIARKPITLAAKAKFFEDEIDLRHRRTEYGYVLGVALKRPGDKSGWTQHDSDNDGLWTSMYGAGECFAYAATGDELARKRARAAFEALRFLGTVTQGGSHPAPRGFVARTVLPASGPNPNLTQYTRERDEQTRATRDRLWKVLVPRWPLSADGKWCWKTDTSSDELDGHYFFYGLYHDLVARDEAARQPVREHVAALTDHLIEHNFQLVDHDGQPTRWGVFNPETLNRDANWWEERGLNALSILSYLATAGHITGQAKYREAARRLMERHNYDMNVLIPKTPAGPGSGNQSDDEMAFMCFHHLMRYETDPRLRAIYGLALRQRAEIERPELNPLFNFIAAASLEGVEFTDAFNRRLLTLTGDWLEESVDTLKRYPLDRVNWRAANSHRKDVVALPRHAAGAAGARRGHRRDGRVLPIDERFVEHWNHDPWQLDQGGDGRGLADGASFLLPYYLGRYHKFILE